MLFPCKTSKIGIFRPRFPPSNPINLCKLRSATIVIKILQLQSLMLAQSIPRLIVLSVRNVCSPECWGRIGFSHKLFIPKHFEHNFMLAPVANDNSRIICFAICFSVDSSRFFLSSCCVSVSSSTIRPQLASKYLFMNI